MKLEDILVIDEVARTLEESARMARASALPSSLELAVPKFNYPVEPIRDPDQEATVTIDERRKRIFFYQLSSDEVGVIRRLANIYYANMGTTDKGDELWWYVDHVSQYDAPIKRMLANVNSPLSVYKPFYQQVEWLASNFGNYTHKYRVICEGFIAHKDDEKALLQLASRGVI